MSAETETKQSGLDTLLVLLALGVLVASIAGFYYLEGQFHPVLRTLGMLAGGVVAVFIGLQTAMGKTAFGYIQGSRVELRRVVWPSRKETLQATLMILGVVLILAMFLWGLDAILVWAMQIFTGRG
ncbi:MAG: preprotein translocase subunit SecE [Salinisphaeraceae bacterium]|nr:preprotein translocase subunit SecE [Salinisphaeraceae bacterium]